MIHGECIILSENGLRVPLKQLELIGIGADSNCWAVVVPDRSMNQPPEHDSRTLAHPPHLVVSPFHPATWLLLLKIVLRVNDQIGALHTAIHALSKLRVNILAHHFTPSGHNHGTLTLIGTARTPKMGNLRREWISWTRRNPNANIHARQKHIQKAFFARLLQAADLTSNAIRDRHSAEPFLRDRFLYAPECRRVKKATAVGLIVDPRQLSVSLARRFFQHTVKAIDIEWLQFPAYHWFFGDTDNAIQLHCDPTTHQLRVIPEHKKRYHKALSQVWGPAGNSAVPAIASLDTEARSARIIPLRRAYGDHYRVSLTYECDAGATRGTGSVGLLASLTAQLKQSGATIWHMSNRIHQLGEHRESADIEFWVADPMMNPKRAQQFPQRIVECLEDRSGAGWPRAVRIISGPLVRRVTARSVFVSTRTAWWTDRRTSAVPQMVEDLLHERGYEIRVCPSEDHPGSPRDDAVKQIAACDGVLQIIPKLWTDTADPQTISMHWMLLEWGIAIGSGKPCVLALECYTDQDRAKWFDAYRVAGNVLIEQWDSRKPADVLRDQLAMAVQRLDAKLGGR